MEPTPEQLFKYADRYARRAEQRGAGTQYPTVRQAAKRFRVPQTVIEQVCEEDCGDGSYLGMAVAIGMPGFGFANFDCLGDCLVEAYAL